MAFEELPALPDLTIPFRGGIDLGEVGHWFNYIIIAAM